MKRWDVLGVGCATIDDLFFIEDWPSADAKRRILDKERQGGGLTATALVAGARLGARCAFGGRLGHDEISRAVAEILEKEGVDCAPIAWRDEAAAIHSTVIVDLLQKTRNIFFHRPGAVGPAPDAPSEAEIRAARVLLIDHYGEAGNTRAVEIARANGVPVVADFERRDVENWEDFFPRVDHLVLSRDFAALLTGENEPQNSAAALWNSHREVVVVTDGARGGWSVENGEKPRPFAAFGVEVADTTGCGDAFHGVYAATLAWGWPLEERLKWASAAAALKARHIGAQKGLPTRAQVEEFLETRGKN